MAQTIQVTYAREREQMVELQLRRRGIRDELVLDAMLAVPRHEFVEPGYRDYAYDDRPVPIGAGQTISQPYMVAVMIEALRLNGEQRVLEIGTGSGYQTAVLSRLCARVYTMEREPELVEQARATLERLDDAGMVEGFRIELLTGDGTLGFPPAAPYDGIVVAAGAPAVPHALVEQLAEGGRLVIPVGGRDCQQLRLLQRSFGQLINRVVNECRFVPLVGAEGWPD